MAIYRGPGGSGDAVNDSSSETRLAVEARDAALAAQAAAEAAQAAAETAETNAETAETNAETAETNAETAATNAASSASAASTSASNAASSASSASTSATNAASSASSASSSASAASTSATNAATSATNAANSATAAATSATNASNSATAAASSASSASSSASTATTQASNASTSATNAASSATSAASSASTATTQAGLASTSATNAANSASAASTSATNASNSASAASTSASNAATSATAAQTAETNAETAQAAAEAARDAALSAYDNFDDRYLGPKASDPTLDNDGNALVSGALYFNTTTNVMKVYTGSSWVAAYVSAAGVLLVANNLSDLASASTARTNLGLGTAATTAATDYATAAQGAKADTALQPAAIGVSVQGYDANTAKLNAAQSWSAAQSFNAGVTLGDASGDALTINSSAVSIPNGLNFDSNTLVIDATNNRVGVGIASPLAPLHVVGGITNDLSGSAGLTTNIIANTGNTNYLVIKSASANTYGLRISANSADDVASISNYYSAALTFGTANTERMRITSGGNVGIGTSSPASYGSGANNLVVYGAASSGITIASGTSNAGNLFFADGTTGNEAYRGYIQYNHSTDVMGLGVGGDTRVLLNSSGNLGIGVTPAAWSGFKSLDFSAVSYSDLGNIRNAFYNGSSYIYRSTAAAAQYQLGSTGTHNWFVAPSGTAGNAVSFTTAMTLDNSGNLGLGVTPSAWSGYGSILEMKGPAWVGSANSNIAFGANWYYNGTNSIYKTTAAATYYQQNAGAHSWGIAASGTAGTAITFTQAMTLDASGNLQLGTTTSKTTAISGSGNGLTIGGATAPTLALYDTTNTAYYSAFGQIDTNTYLYNYAAGALIFGSNAAERMRIDSSGNVGIGTSSPSAKLTVSSGSIRLSDGYEIGWGDNSSYIVGNGTSDTLQFVTAAAERMRITSSGQLLLGTTGGYAFCTIQAPSSGYALGLVNDPTLGYSQIYYGGTNSSAYTYIRGDGRSTGYLSFATADTERFRIGSAGQLGIGGANYGTSGQVLTSNGSGSAPSWQTVSGGQYFGTATTKAIAYNSNTISENITVTAGNNGLSAGPVTVSTGYTVTVQTGANWVIV